MQKVLLLSDLITSDYLTISSDIHLWLVVVADFTLKVGCMGYEDSTLVVVNFSPKKRVTISLICQHSGTLMP